MNIAIVENGIVSNVLVVPDDYATDENGWRPADGQTVVTINDGDAPHIGLAYSNGVFSQPALPTVVAPTVAQQAAQLLSAGLTVSSTGTPAINGIYAVDQLSQMDIIAVETSLNAGKGFPGGATSFNYADTSGAFHAFTSANFTDFAAAVRDYVYALKAVIAGASTALPAPSTTIA